MRKFCVLCGEEIFPHEPYAYYGDDTLGDTVRAHTAHIALKPYRWAEIGRSLKLTAVSVVPA